MEHVIFLLYLYVLGGDWYADAIRQVHDRFSSSSPILSRQNVDRLTEREKYDMLIHPKNKCSLKITTLVQCN